MKKKSKPAKVVKKVVEETTAELNEELIDQFSSELELAINKVCENNDGTDPRLELLVTLIMAGAQVATDCDFDKEELLKLVSDIFEDVAPEIDESLPEINSTTKSKLLN